MEQNIRFCPTDDGVRIAYATTGKGTPIARPGHWLTHLEYDLKNPERVSHLILYGAFARGRVRPQMLDAMCTPMQQGWGSDNASYRELFSASYVPSGNREHIGFLNELEKVSATPEMAAKYMRVNATVDVRDLLSEVKAPTLVLHRRGDRAVKFKYGRGLASGIAGATFVPMEGKNHLFLEDEPAQKTFFEEVGRFLGDKPPAGPQGRAEAAGARLSQRDRAPLSRDRALLHGHRGDQRADRGGVVRHREAPLVAGFSSAL